MANTVQLKRSSVAGRIPDAANVAVGEPVVNLSDKVLYTKNGSGDIIQIAAGNLQALADVSNATPNVNDVISWTGAEWAPRIVTEGGGGSTVYANVLVGQVEVAEYTANGTGTTFDLNFVPSSANSLIIFVDGVIQAPTVNYTVSGDIVTFTSAPETNAIISVRYFDSSDVYEARYFVGVPSSETFTANGSGQTFELTDSWTNSADALVFVNGVIQEPTTNYSISGSTLTFTEAPDANAKVFVRTFSQGNEVDLGNLVVNVNAVPQVSQALIWNGSAYEPGNVSTSANVVSVNGYTGVVSLALADLSDVSSNVPNPGQALVWDANASVWAPGNVISSGGGTGGNVIVGITANEYFVANGTGNTFVLSTDVPNYPEQLIVFVNSVLQEPNTNYTVSNDILSIIGTPAPNAEISVRYITPGSVVVDLGNVAVDLATAPTTGQALVWNGTAYAPDNVASSTTISLSLYNRFEFVATAGQYVFSGNDSTGKRLYFKNPNYIEVYLNGIRLINSVDFIANATQIVLTDSADAGDNLSIITFVDSTGDFSADSFTGDSSTVQFNLSQSPSNDAAILVSFNGVKQHVSEYSVTGNVITFNTAPDTGIDIEIVHLAGPSGTSSSGSDVPWLEVASNTTVTPYNKYMANTVGGSITLTLPADPSLGDTIHVLDGTGSFDTSNVLVLRNGNKIMGQTEDLYLDIENSYTQLVYFNSAYGWRVIS